MNGLVELLLGPLAGPECRRALGRGWLLVVRWLAALPAVLLVLGVVWFAWLYHEIAPGQLPGGIYRGGLVTLETILVLGAVVLCPAFVAGTLAGDKARGTLEMLLAAQVSSHEIVVGRMAGRLAIVVVLLLAGLPGLGFLAGLGGLSPFALALTILLPAAVSFGAAGLSIATSAVAQRGRDALVGAYVAVIVLIIGPPMAAPLVAPAAAIWLEAFNPFSSAYRVAAIGETLPALRSIAVWLLLGLLGVAWASWRIRPAQLRQVDRRTSMFRRRRRLPPIGERPMLWKELYVENLARFSRIVRFLITTVLVVMLLGTVALAACIVSSRFVYPDPGLDAWATSLLTDWSAYFALPISWLIQWGMGLRAAAAVASEREQATWDPLMASPLEGREIVAGKIFGSLYAMRGLLAAAAIAWTIDALVGAMPASEYWTLLLNTLVASTFMAAVGVACSLMTTSAARAMAITSAAWLAAMIGLAFVAMLGTAVFMLILLLAESLYSQLLGDGMGQTFGTVFLGLVSFGTAWTMIRAALYLLTAALVALYCRSRFDVLCGRVPEIRYQPRLSQPTGQ